MTGKRQQPIMITAEEAVKLGREQGSTNSIDRAVEIVQEWQKAPQFPDSPAYDYWCMLATIYDAGRIQGMRAERQRRNGKKVI